MYYPKQIPYLLSKTFKDKVEYIEYHVKDIEDYCMCIWQMKSKKILDEVIYNPILPDACIDMIIDFTNKKIFFAGFSKKTEVLELSGKIDFMGIRLKPGAFYALFGIEADKIMDDVLYFSKVEKEINLDNILFLTNTTEKIECLKKYFQKKGKNNPDKKFIEIVNELYNNPIEQNVIDISKKIGYDKRHLVRIFKKHYGISPKVLLNILRLNLCLTLLLDEKKHLTDIAMMCGFYDQPHFIKELKRYTGISPIQLLESYHI